MRIVSLLPSATDTIVALGAINELVGVSHSCSGDWQHLPRLTSTWIDTRAPSAAIDAQVRAATRPLYELDIETLEQLAPDVVVSQSLCDVCAVPSGDVRAAMEALPGPPTLVDVSPHRLKDLPECFAAVGAAIGRTSEAEVLCSRWHEALHDLRDRHANSGLRVAFLDWLDPPFAAGHWVPDMLEWLGVESALGRSGEPSYAVSWEAVAQSRPDLIVAACCGFDAPRAHLDAAAAPRSIVHLDGHELFSRPSPALVPSLKVLAQAIDDHLNHV